MDVVGGNRRVAVRGKAEAADGLAEGGGGAEEER
jgi:hypothetical protein